MQVFHSEQRWFVSREDGSEVETLAEDQDCFCFYPFLLLCWPANQREIFLFLFSLMNIWAVTCSVKGERLNVIELEGMN